MAAFHFVALPDAHHGHHDLAVMVGPAVAGIIMSPDEREPWTLRVYDHAALNLPPVTAGKFVDADSFEQLEAWLKHHDDKRSAA